MVWPVGDITPIAPAPDFASIDIQSYRMAMAVGILTPDSKGDRDSSETERTATTIWI